MAKLIKFFALDPSALYSPTVQLEAILQPLLSVLNRSSDEELDKLGFKTNGRWNSPLIASLLAKNNSPQGFSIVVGDDLSITEDGLPSLTTVSQSEKEVLGYLMANNARITKEKVAEIKWGENSFDGYSDQAIRKTIVRLSSKLKRYRIRPLSKVEYVLIRR